MKLADELSLLDTAERLAGREISARELAQDFLARIEAVDPSLNSYITVTAELALEQAQEAEEALMGGLTPGPLHGIPIALKDLFETKGIRTTAGSKFLVDYLPKADCSVYQKLRSAGAVLLGKLNMHEWAFGVTNVNPHYGPCRNPWDTERISGGSSGGSAAALAAGLCLGSAGTDTGGSIRIPASLCGIVGLKPTYGMIDLQGVIPLSRSLDHAGPMARRVEDAALLYAILSGSAPDNLAPYLDPRLSEEERLPGSLRNRLLEALRAEPGHWRVALASDPYFSQADGHILDAVSSAAVVLGDLGARVSQEPFPGGAEAWEANIDLLLAEAASYHAGRMRTRPQDFGDDVRERLRKGAQIGEGQIARARQAKVALREQFTGFFNDYDFLLTATTPVAAVLVSEIDPLRPSQGYNRLTAPFNLTGLPALSIPCGFTPEGLPVGLQIVGPAGSEWRLLQVGYTYQQAARG